MGFSFKRAFTPPKRVFIPPKKISLKPPKIVSQAVRLATAPMRIAAVGVLSTVKPDLAKKVGGLNGGELGIAKLVGAGTLAVGGGVLASKAGLAGKLANAVKGPLAGIFKGKGNQLQEQAQAVEDSTTTAEGGQARDDAPEPFVQASAKPGNLGIFVEPPQSLSAQQAAPGAQIAPAGDWLDSLIKTILSFFGA